MATSESLESRDQYTVGWIAALPLELAAATSMLDEEHKKPLDFEQPSTDDNTYTWGRIGGHNVVIASLAAGVYGTTSAATTAISMLHSFPYIRVGLMVGIGAGIARPKRGRDIRMGDVAVCQPDGRTGGVLQYGFRKAKTEGKLEPKGFLNMPPRALLTALANLQAQHERKPSKVPEFLKEMLRNNPQMARSRPGKPSYAHQGEGNDRLFEPKYEHVDGLSCNNCDSHQEILRDKRDSIEPEIHYGIIASGSTPVKDAAIRDSILQHIGEECICFEMEAAGLMNNFPCLVIRGICDYADSHKSDRWQRYAAATAAGYAKELLGVLPSEDLEKIPKAGDVIKSITQELSNIRSATNKFRLDNYQQKVIKWLSPPDSSVNYNEALKRRHPGSGLWFLDHDIFTQWKTRPSSFLWLYGITGCGKTILSSAIIEDLDRNISHPRLVLYFYFNFNDTSKQSLESMIRSLISQLYHKREDTRKHLDSLFSSCDDGNRQSPTKSLCQSLLFMIQRTDEVWIVLDALDECCTRKGTETEGLLSWMRGLLSVSRNAHLLVTSRQEEDIESALTEWVRNEDMMCIQSKLVNDDICKYVHTRIREDDGFRRWRSSPRVQKQIETSLVGKAGGMFRWAACQVDALENCLDYPELQEALASLPDTLDETYARILNAITPGHKQKAIRILQFLAFSERPLRIEEAVDAIAVDPKSQPRFDPRNRMPEPKEISRYCSSLVVVVRRSIGEYDERMVTELKLSHFSVKEYLISDRLAKNFTSSFQEISARASIATVCLAYLLHLDGKLPVLKIRENFPLAQYCARYWKNHAAVTEGGDAVLQGFIEELFSHPKRPYTNCYRLYSADEPMIREPHEPAAALYYASLEGLTNTVKNLIVQGADVNAQGGHFGNALLAASYKGHGKIVQTLVNAEADINAQSGYLSSALLTATDEGHEEIVRTLLNEGADINAQGGYLGSALQAASYRGHEKIVQTLLNEGADINAQGGHFGNALQAASYRGHEKIVQTLLNEGADINAQGRHFGNIHIGQTSWHEKADILPQDEHLDNALQAASYEEQERIVQTLLNEGVDINAESEYFRNALQAAWCKGQEKIVQTSLNAETDINAQGGHFDNALQTASNEEQKKIVQRLLNDGADINAQSEYFDNALQAACCERHEIIFQTLLKVNAQGGYFGDALQAACCEGHEKIIQTLLHEEVDINAQGEHFGNALQAAASYKGHEKIVRTLLHKEADINALQAAASYKEHEKIIQTLLNKEVDVNAQGEKFGNALQAASYEGHEKIVQTLLNEGVDINAQSGYFGNALQTATSKGREKIVQTY